jgi:macrolide-specific efflux system membrane fusion protein
MKKIIFILIVLALAGGGFWFWKAHKQKSADQESAQKFVPAEVELKTLRRTVESTGEVQPENRLNVKSPIAGRIDELLVDEGDEVTQGQIVAWISSTERATLLDTARAKGEEEVRYWKEIYKAAPLISPMAGTVIARNFEPGQTITANDAVVVIADRLILVGRVDETDIGSVSPNQPVDVQLDAYPEAVFSGHVSAIAYDSKLVSNVTMYEVDVFSETIPDFARSGMTATLTFLVEEHQNVPAVPTSALTWQAGRASVMRPGKAGKEPVSQPVKTGLSENSLTEIVKGLDAGDTILIPQLTRSKSNGTNPFLPFGNQRSGARTNSGSSTRSR